jgi:hypothetical protein
MRLSYILPIKWDGDQDTVELTLYLETISRHVDLIIVDGSSPINYEQHKAMWGNFSMHLPPDETLDFINGKVNGVITGLRLAKYNEVIIADDDVRYNLDQLVYMQSLLGDVQLVVPQNYFSPNPWHGQWDTSRSLLNRAINHDYPGTLAIQRDFINPLGGYDGDVMFENLELIRTVKAGYGQVLYKDDLYIRRLPPTDGHFWSQRVRQAFDDNAQPLRLGFFILLLPALIAAAFLSPLLPVILLALSILVAETGRHKFQGSRVFPLACSFYAPCWLLERGFCTWLALFHKLRNGGIQYNGRIIRIAANPIWKIRMKLQSKQFAGGSGL